ncbi:MAG: molybdenum cofactor biosynthesis protein MoaE [Pseudomonadota bacterium]
MIHIAKTPFEPATLLREFQQDMPDAGAIVSFTGCVRPQSGDDPVTSLYLEIYPPMTEDGIAKARQQALNRWPLHGLAISHRIGEIAPSEAIVFVAAASAHRRAAFEAADFVMDYLKTDAVFWKRETRASGTVWIEPRREDYADRDRWRQTGTTQS